LVHIPPLSGFLLSETTVLKEQSRKSAIRGDLMSGLNDKELAELRKTFASGGTPLMELVQTTGIDPPLKALVWQDASGITWLSYTDPKWLAKRHGLHSEVGATVSILTAALTQMARSATK
jgi:hypothetical protein